MSRICRNNNLPGTAYSYAPGTSRIGTPVAVESRTPATELEQAEEPVIEDALLQTHSRILRWIFEQSVLRIDGKLMAPTGIAVRMFCLASLLKLEPVESMTFEQIAQHCGVTRAAISKAMLDLSVITGIRSRQQRSDDARYAYRQRAIKVHQRKRTQNASEVTTLAVLTTSAPLNTATSE